MVSPIFMEASTCLVLWVLHLPLRTASFSEPSGEWLHSNQRGTSWQGQKMTAPLRSLECERHRGDEKLCTPASTLSNTWKSPSRLTSFNTLRGNSCRFASRQSPWRLREAVIACTKIPTPDESKNGTSCRSSSQL